MRIFSPHKTKPTEWLIDDWLPLGSVTMLTGRRETDRQKVVLCEHVQGLLAAGETGWIKSHSPHNTTHRPELIVMPGNPLFDRQQIRQQGIRTGQVSVFDKPLWIQGEGARCEGLNLQDQAAEEKVRLLVINAVEQAYQRRDNSVSTPDDAEDIRAFMASWDDWAVDHDAAVVMLSSTSHNAYDHRRSPWGQFKDRDISRRFWLMESLASDQGMACSLECHRVLAAGNDTLLPGPLFFRHEIKKRDHHESVLVPLTP